MKETYYIFILFFSFTLTCLGQVENAGNDLWNPNQQDTINERQGSSYGRDFQYRKGKADGFNLIAELERENDNLPGALRYYLSAIYEYEIIGDSNSIANIRLEIGEIFQEAQLYDKALEYYTHAELFFLNEGSITNNAELLENIAQTYYEKGEFQKSLNYYQRIEKIFQRNKQDDKVTATYFNMVKCLNQLGQFGQSLMYNQKILDYYKKTANKKQEIICLNNLGYTHKNLGNYEEALEHFEEALEIEKEINGTENPITLVNLAIVYQNLDKNKRSLEYLHKAAGMVEKLGDNSDAAEFNHLTSVVYFNMKDYYNAQISNKEAIRRAKIVNNPGVLEAAYLLSSKIHEALYDYESSMLDYQKYLVIRDSIQRSKAQSQSDLTETAFLVERVSHDAENLWATEEISYLDLQRLKLDSANREQELQLFYQTDSIQRITIANQQLENDRALQELLLKEEQIYAAKKEKEVDSLRQIERIQSLELETQKLVQKEQESQIELLDKENQLNELNLKKVQARNKFLIGLAALAIIIIYIVYRSLRYAKRTNKILHKQKNEIERQKDEIEYERERSDKLLLNILPEETAEELKEKGSATPKHYDQVSVLFTDFKGFTNIAEKLTPKELVAELNNCFLEFDKIIDKHKLEKIKTIGDAYMCAGGIPVENTTNPIDIVKAGLEIKDYMENLKKERETAGEDFWELRIGIHTGPVVAGVVGKNKFAYDIWGDAVNTASRMESSGVPGKVNISGETYEIIKDQFKCTYRGKIKAKNKGEVDMYIVES